MSSEKTAAILVIGNEVLAGEVDELNATFLGRELHDLGVSLRHVQVVPDDVPLIGDAVRWAVPRFDFVLTTGGVGPTHDDVTIAGVARGLDTGTVRVPELEEKIRGFYGRRVNEFCLRMADVPDGTTLLWEDDLVFPMLRARNVWIFPGAPTILRKKWAAVRHHFKASPFFVKRLYTTKDEPEIAALLARLAKDFPAVWVGSYPVYPTVDYKVLVKLESKDRGQFEDAVNRLTGAFPLDTIVRIE